MQNVIYLIKRIEDGFYKGGIYYKKSNRFEYGTTFDDAVKYYSMTRDNAEIEHKYLTNNGYTCFIEPIVIKDKKGDCAYSLNDVKKYILYHLSNDLGTVYPVESVCDYLWNASLIDMDDEDCKELLDGMATDKTCNVEYHIPSGGYLYVV